MKYLITCLIIVSSLCVEAQNDVLNQYKYIIVDNQYEFQGEANEYRFNELIVFELEKRNFQAYRNSQVLPADLNIGACNSLRLKINKTGTLRVKMILELEDCQGNVVYTTKEGIGKTKSNKIAYFEALRDAMTSLDEVDYQYIEPTMKQIKQELPKFDKKVKDTKPAKTDKNDNEVPLPPKPEFVERVGDQIYRTKSKEYFIISTAKGFDIYKNKGLIGTLKKSKGGCYFVETVDFMGVAYETSKGIIIEYTYFGKDKILEFIK